MTLEKSITEYGCVEIMRTENKAKLSKKRTLETGEKL